MRGLLLTVRRRDARAWFEHVFILAVMCTLCALYCDGAFGQITNQVASGDSVWAAVKTFFYGKWALVIGCLVLVGCVFAFFSKGALFASVGVAAVVIIYLLPAIAQGLQSLAQSLVGN
jgi:hypothetical protein